jgi:hypothetical protein
VSYQRKRGQPPRPWFVREALLRTAIGCDQQPTTDCRRLLAGRLNVKGAVTILTWTLPTMSDSTAASLDVAPRQDQPAAATPTPLAPSPDALRPSAVQPSACGCQTGAPQLVYALGQLGYDLVREARCVLLLSRAAGADGAPGLPVYGGRQRHRARDGRPDPILVHPLNPSPAAHRAGQPTRRLDMKLPPQVAAVVREGHSWPARRLSAHGVSASAPRTDVNVCRFDSAKPKCDGGRSVCVCDSGACQCCDTGRCHSVSGGECVCG